MAVLPVSNIVNVTVTNTPSGLSERNVNNIMLFTTETPSSLNDYDVAITPSQVAELYGTNSVTAQMANALFAPDVNIRTGGGSLYIAPLQASVSATSGDVTTADISANLNDILLVTDGDLRVTVDGVDYDLTGLNFTNGTTLADVATILDNALVNAIVTAPTASTLKFLSKKVGAAADVSLAAVPAGTGTDLSGAGYFNAAGATETSGADASGETIAAAIARLEDQVQFAGVMTNLEMEDAVLTALANTVQAQDRIFVHHVCSTVDISAGVGETIRTASNDQTRIVGYTESLAAANLFKSAYVGRLFSVNFNGTNTSSTGQLKALPTITPDSGMTQTLYTQALANGVDVYVSIDGVSSLISSGGNDYFDNVYNKLALKFALEVSGFNYLRQTNTKIPQTEAGMEGLKDAYAEVCRRFVTVGVIAGGTWTSSERFGDPATFDQNILQSGYYVYSIPITEQSAVDRAARKAPLVQIAIKFAGAIHTSDVLAVINY